MPNITITPYSDGALTYVVHHAASDLPPVRGRDILMAWDRARDAARLGASDCSRTFRFRSKQGGWTELSLSDADARCWAGAVDRAFGMRTGYGLSVYLRLLALVDLLAQSPWAATLIGFDKHDVTLDPRLLRFAAETRLADDASFDKVSFYGHLSAVFSPVDVGKRSDV